MAVRVRTESYEETVRRLETFIHRMERRYECPTDFVEQATLRGYMKETAEIGRWLTSYRTLGRLRQYSSIERGMATPIVDMP